MTVGLIGKPQKVGSGQCDGSGMFIPDSEYWIRLFTSRIPDPGSRDETGFTHRVGLGAGDFSTVPVPHL